MTATSAFEKYRAQAYPHVFHGTLLVHRIAGGIPTDPKKAEGWLRSKLGVTDERLIQAQVAEVMAERGVSADEAVAIVDSNRHLNGFKRAAVGLYIEGRQLKAGIKEAANVRWPKRKWGPSNKGTRSYFAEHVFVLEDKLPLGVDEPTGVVQRFVHTFRGSGIQYEEYCDDVKIAFSVATDVDFTAEDWALLWLTGEQQGIGATRSQGYGRYLVTDWKRVQ